MSDIQYFLHVSETGCVFFSACFFALQEAEISAADVTIQWLQQEALEPGPTVCSPCQMALSKNGGYRDTGILQRYFHSWLCYKELT